MIESHADKAEPNNLPRPRPTRLWRWFAIGFLVVFIGMLVLTDRNVMLPSGKGLMRCRLWQYYKIGFRGAFSTTNMTNLGPASGNVSAAMTTAVEHILCSVIGGGVLMAAGSLIRKTRR